MLKNNTFIYLLIPFVFISCGQEAAEEQTRVSELPTITPEKLIASESAGDFYFDHLGYFSIPLPEGEFLLPDRSQSRLYHLNEDISLLSVAASEGQGPGEMEDPNFLTLSSEGGGLVYDQANSKVLEFNGEGVYENEFVLPAGETANSTDIYQLDESLYIVVFRSFEYLGNLDSEPKAYLTVYDKEKDAYIFTREISDRAFARNVIDGEPRGGRQVPFTAEHLRAYNPKDETLSLYWSGSDEIATVNADLDTLSTISIDLHSEELGSEEREQILDDTPDGALAEMEKLLPETKSIADDMIIDTEGRHWLHLNHQSEYEQWAIINEDGEPEKIVQLPEDSMLLHVSRHHLGVRLDHHLFALFENVSSGN